MSFTLAVFLNGAVAPTNADDEIILELSGKIDSGTVRLTRSDIEKLPKHRVRTWTPWHGQVTEFDGVLLRELMKFVGANGKKIQVVALNNYATEIPVEDFAKYDVILAYKKDGNYMPIREKGPFFIIYPYDSDLALKTDKYYFRSAWQVATITVD